MKSSSLTLIPLIFLLTSNLLKAETLSIFDDSFTFVSAQSLLDGQTYSARFGVWNGDFDQRVTGPANTGVMEISLSSDFFELTAGVSQIDNTNFAVGEQFSVAIFSDGSNDAQALNWSDGSLIDFVILTDPSWLIPTFSNNSAFIFYSFSSNTTAVAGGFDWNGGSPILTAVPEPSTYAAIVGLLALAMVGYRRFRS